LPNGMQCCVAHMADGGMRPLCSGSRFGSSSRTWHGELLLSFCAKMLYYTSSGVPHCQQYQQAAVNLKQQHRTRSNASCAAIYQCACPGLCWCSCGFYTTTTQVTVCSPFWNYGPTYAMPHAFPRSDSARLHGAGRSFICCMSWSFGVLILSSFEPHQPNMRRRRPEQDGYVSSEDLDPWHSVQWTAGSMRIPVSACKIAVTLQCTVHSLNSQVKPAIYASCESHSSSEQGCTCSRGGVCNGTRHRRPSCTHMTCCIRTIQNSSCCRAALASCPCFACRSSERRCTRSCECFAALSRCQQCEKNVCRKPWRH
jgi:hypothetical protein